MANVCERTVREFLELLDREHYHVYAASTEGKALPIGFASSDIDELIRWITKRNETSNIYYALNSPSPSVHKKASKQDVKTIWGVHCDIDPPGNVKRNSPAWGEWIAAKIDALEAYNVPATIVCSGNGLQALWLFKEPLEATSKTIDRIEVINRFLAEKFDAPSGTHNVDRILRVPGTMNHPTAKKIRLKYEAVPATLHRAAPLCELDDFAGVTFTKKANVKRPVESFVTDTYSEDYMPLSWESLLTSDPSIVADCSELLSSSGDRSAAAWLFMHRCIEFLYVEHKCLAFDFLSDANIHKNVCEIFAEAAESSETINVIFEHYVQHPKGLAHIFYDVNRAIASAADDGKGYIPGADKVRGRASKDFELASAPVDKLRGMDIRKAFIQHVVNSVEVSEFPNIRYTKNGEVCVKQPLTDANVRHIFDSAGMRLRHNVLTGAAHVEIEDERLKELWDANFPVTANAVNDACIPLLLDCMCEFGMEARAEAASIIAEISSGDMFSPLQAYVDSVPWDGIPRINKVGRCINALDQSVCDRYIEVFFLQTAATLKSLSNYRITGDGLSIPQVVVLVGAQGTGKSTFWSKVTPSGMRAPLTQIALGSAKTADSMQGALSGLVCVLEEIGASQTRSEGEALKNFISSTVDTYRPAYARRAITRPRCTVFCGTSNRFTLYDTTGNRRYLPIEHTHIDWDAVNALPVQQLYAEAYHRVMNGEDWFLTVNERKTLTELTDGITAENTTLSAILEYLDDALETPNVLEWVTSAKLANMAGVKVLRSEWVPIGTALAKRNVKSRQRNGYRQWLIPIKG